jgi:hypothetical protein
VLSGTSSNTTLVPNANILFGGSGANRTVTITPASGQLGMTNITLTVSYVLERRGDLDSGPWTPVTSAGPLAADGPVNLTDPAPPAGSAFYRMRVSAP